MAGPSSSSSSSTSTARSYGIPNNPIRGSSTMSSSSSRTAGSRLKQATVPESTPLLKPSQRLRATTDRQALSPLPSGKQIASTRNKQPSTRFPIGTNVSAKETPSKLANQFSSLSLSHSSSHNNNNNHHHGSNENTPVPRSQRMSANDANASGMEKCTPTPRKSTSLAYTPNADFHLADCFSIGKRSLGKAVFVSSKPADMDTPTFAVYQRTKYPGDVGTGSSEITPSKKATSELDLSEQLYGLSLQANPRYGTPEQMERVAKSLYTKRSPVSRLTPHRSASKTFGIGSTPGSAKKSALLNTPNTWLAKKATDKRKANFDRFIPNRQAMDLGSSQFQMGRAGKEGPVASAASASIAADIEVMDGSGLAYQYEVAKACGLALDRRILAFHEQPPMSDKEELKTKYNRPLRPTTNTNVAKRKIPTVPERVLDAPGILDDYYLNLLDWSTSNILAVGLGSAVYLWNASSGTVDELCAFDNDEPVTSLSWCQDGAHLAVADNNGETQLWNVENKSLMRTLRDAPSRIGSLSWNRQLLSTGTREGSIHNHDVRLAASRTSDYLGHEGEVCGLKWSPDGQQMASGGNDNLVNIWDARTTVAKYSKRDHTAAVKALAWCPWQSNLLATGGGSDDRKICFWNSVTGVRQSRIDTGSQVTGILWSKNYRELISSHGFTDNQVIIWKYPTMQKVVEIPNAHSSRILHMSMSPDGQTVCSGAADENLKFWKVFAVEEKYMKTKVGGGGGGKGIANADGKKPNKSPDFGCLNMR